MVFNYAFTFLQEEPFLLAPQTSTSDPSGPTSAGPVSSIPEFHFIHEPDNPARRPDPDTQKKLKEIAAKIKFEEYKLNQLLDGRLLSRQHKAGLETELRQRVSMGWDPVAELTKLRALQEQGPSIDLVTGYLFAADYAGYSRALAAGGPQDAIELARATLSAQIAWLEAVVGRIGTLRGQIEVAEQLDKGYQFELDKVHLQLEKSSQEMSAAGRKK